MKAEQISASIFSRAGSGDTQLIYGLDKDQWLNTITAGQILKGRVLRTYTDNKYGVNFAGQERVVDSAIPLAKGDTLTGRVTGVKDNTVSMKLVNDVAPSELKSSTLEATGQSGPQTLIDIEAKNFKIDLTQLQKSVINKVSNQIGNATVAIRAGLYVAKLGLPVTLDLVRVLAERLLHNPLSNITDFEAEIPQLASSLEVSRAQQLNAAESLKTFYLKQVSDDQGNNTTETDSPHESESNQVDSVEQADAGDGSQGDWLQRQQLNQMLLKLLNVSNESHVQHRLQTLPLMIDGKLVEFDVAFFDQAEQDNDQLVLKSKRLKFALNTDFGLLNLEANVVNDRLNVNFSAESAYFLEQLGEAAPDLKESLSDVGWIVDNLSYLRGVKEDSAAYDVVKHVLMQNSLDIEI